MDLSLKPPKNLNLNGNLAEEWRKFRQNFEIFLKAGSHSDKNDDVKVAILLNCVGEEAVELFNTFDLTDIQRKTLADVLTAFENYSIPRRNVVVERFVFNSRVQEANERFDEFLTDLRKLVKYCEYGTLVDSVIRDRIVLGVADKQVQERLLREAELTLIKAINICRAAEVVKKQSEVIQCKVNVDMVNKKRSAEFRAVNVKKRFPASKDTSSRDILYLCKKCNTTHSRGKCPAYGKKCKLCKRFNHFAVGCRFKEVNAFQSVVIDSVNANSKSSCWMQGIQVGGKTLNFKLDTGASVNILPDVVLKNLNCKNVMKQTGIILEAFGGHKVKPLGLVILECKLNNIVKNLEFVIVNRNQYTRPLLGLPSCMELGLVKRQVDILEVSDRESFIENNRDVFEGLGQFNLTCTIKIDENAKPIARPPRRIPEIIKCKLKDKLEILENDGIISRVENPEGWINNLVIVEKPNGSIRVCLDPQDLNKVVKRDYYLIPTVEELIPKLCNKNVYSVFDLKDGFYQIKLDQASSKLCQFNSPFGCFRFNRLPFGINMAPEVFQKFNEKNFGDISGVLIYIDDMLVCANSKTEHDEIVNKIIERARKLNVKFNSKKLQYRVNEVKYLGYVFNKNGMKPDPEHVKAIMNLHIPSDKKELQRILGMINYLRKFIPNMSEVTAPLRELLKTSVCFSWMPIHSKALNQLKDLLCKAPVLGTLDPNKQIVLQCDSSKSGLGCCLLQEGRPISFASRALSDAEQNYAQVEKEYLSIVFATKKFHNFIYGKKVIVHTDHKPLVSIHNKNVVNVLSSRLQRIKLKLLKYDLDIMYVPGKYMYVADLLSRSYVNETDSEDEFLKEIVHCVKATRHMQVTDRKLKQFKDVTNKDPVLNNLVLYCKNGWPDNKKCVPENVRFYFKLREDLFEEDGIVFYNGKILVPRALRREMLEKIHEGHFGIEKTKSRARQIFYWPGMSEDIEKLVTKCSVCEMFKSRNCKEPLISHEILSLPFEKVGCDICQFGRKDYLVLMDYLTKWLEVIPLYNKQASEVIKKLKVIFSTHGIPKCLVADNMPFNSREFKKFALDWDFEVITSSPRYPKSNGQAESGVKIAKSMLKKCYESRRDIFVALMEYRNTPIKSLDFSPAQALMSRRTRTKLPINRDLLKPELQINVKERIVKKQEISKLNYDKTAKTLSEIPVNQNVLIRNGSSWERGSVVERDKMPRSYWVKNENNSILRRNRIDLKPSHNGPNFKRDIEITGSDDYGGVLVKCDTNASDFPTVKEHKVKVEEKPYVTRFGRTVKNPERYGVSTK